MPLRKRDKMAGEMKTLESDVLSYHSTWDGGVAVI